MKVENLLEGIAGVEEAAVCMAESSHWKEAQIVAYLIANSLTEQEVLAILRDRLQRYELPKRIFFVDALPKNASGKVDKMQLRMLE